MYRQFKKSLIGIMFGGLAVLLLPLSDLEAHGGAGGGHGGGHGGGGYHGGGHGGHGRGGYGHRGYGHRGYGHGYYGHGYYGHGYGRYNGYWGGYGGYWGAYPGYYYGAADYYYPSALYYDNNDYNSYTNVVYPSYPFNGGYYKNDYEYYPTTSATVTPTTTYTTGVFFN